MGNLPFSPGPPPPSIPPQSEPIFQILACPSRDIFYTIEQVCLIPLSPPFTPTDSRSSRLVLWKQTLRWPLAGQAVCWGVHLEPTSVRERRKQDWSEGGILTIMQSQERPEPAPRGAPGWMALQNYPTNEGSRPLISRCLWNHLWRCSSLQPWATPGERLGVSPSSTPGSWGLWVGSAQPPFQCYMVCTLLAGASVDALHSLFQNSKCAYSWTLQTDYRRIYLHLCEETNL